MNLFSDTRKDYDMVYFCVLSYSNKILILFIWRGKKSKMRISLGKKLGRILIWIVFLPNVSDLDQVFFSKVGSVFFHASHKEIRVKPNRFRNPGSEKCCLRQFNIKVSDIE